jgi:hypothetical protein
MDNPGTNTDYMTTDLSGKVILSGQLSDSKGKINVRCLFKGMYLLAIGNEHI